MTDKEKLIELIEALPDDLQYFTSTGEYDDVDIRIFVKEKDEKFLDWYFGL